MLTVAPCPILTFAEQSRRNQLETIIDAHVASVIQVAMALAEIKRDQLWRGDYDSFEDFCRGKFGKSKGHSYELAQAGEAVVNLSDESNILPTAFRQVRPLLKLAPDAQRQAWKLALETSPNPVPSEADVARAVATIQTQPMLQPGQQIIVAAGEYEGQTVKVIDIDSVIVQCESASGDAIALLTTELIAPDAEPVKSAPPKAGQASEIIARLETELKIERARTLMIESILRDALPHLPINLRDRASALF